MRILNTKFHDYYDSAMALGHEASVIFSRSQQIELPYREQGWGADLGRLARELCQHAPVAPALDGPARARITDLWRPLAQRFEQAPLYQHARARSHPPYGYESFACAQPMLILLAGKAYPSYAVKSHDDAIRIAYSFQELAEFGALAQIPGHEQREYGVKAGPAKPFERARAFFEQSPSDALSALLVAQRAPLALAWGARARPRPRSDLAAELGLLLRNPRLGDVEFGKRMDAYSVFQELEMFIGGVLPQSGAPTVELTDKDLIAKHGFNHWSFRKPPEPQP